MQTFVDRPWQAWTLASELAFILHVWRLNKTWPTWRESDACCGHAADEVHDAPYQIRWLLLATPSFLIACVAVVQPSVAANLHYFSIVPVIGHPIANIATFRAWVETEMGTWLYLQSYE